MTDVEEVLDETQEAPHPIPYAQPDRAVKPIYLLADSQPLFWKPKGVPFLRSARERIDKSSATAAYVGASNGDDPSYFAIFEAAFGEVGFNQRRMIPAELGPEDLDFVDRADLILLAGGSVEKGWRTFERNGLKQILVRRYYEGSLLMGISAGAVQLGLGGWGDDGHGSGPMIDTFRLLPHVVGAHEEESDWAGLKSAVLRLGGHVRGYGIPAGGGFLYHPDHILEPIRRPLVEIRVRGSEVRQGLLLPGETSPGMTFDPADESDSVVN